VKRQSGKGFYSPKSLKNANIVYTGVSEPDFRRTTLEGFRENSGYK